MVILLQKEYNRSIERGEVNFKLRLYSMCCESQYQQPIGERIKVVVVMVVVVKRK